MKVSIRILRVIVLLGLVLGFLVVGAEIAGHFVGNRVYLLNSTSCEVAVMNEHDGTLAKPGETVLVKSGIIDRTSTLLITANGDIWFGGLHFDSSGKFEFRGHDDIKVSESWFRHTLFGTTLTYELSQQGDLSVRHPLNSTDSQLPQPVGLPIRHLPGPRSNDCARV